MEIGGTDGTVIRRIWHLNDIGVWQTNLTGVMTVSPMRCTNTDSGSAT